MNWGIRVLQTLALPLGYDAILMIMATKITLNIALSVIQSSHGADDEARTRYLHLGKVALYQMSYIRVCWCLRTESNHRHGDFQSPALPTELQRQILATRNGFEPSTSSVTG